MRRFTLCTQMEVPRRGSHRASRSLHIPRGQWTGNYSCPSAKIPHCLPPRKGLTRVSATDYHHRDNRLFPSRPRLPFHIFHLRVVCYSAISTHCWRVPKPSSQQFREGQPVIFSQTLLGVLLKKCRRNRCLCVTTKILQ